MATEVRWKLAAVLVTVCQPVMPETTNNLEGLKSPKSCIYEVPTVGILGRDIPHWYSGNKRGVTFWSNNRAAYCRDH